MATDNWQELTYPISLDYRSHWGNWEAIREIVQNSLDEVGSYTVEKLDTGVAISDKGKGFTIKHLIFGVSEKDSADSRGRFGEGLKIALIVLTRNGCNVSIQSENLEIVVDKAEIEGIRVLKLKYRTIPPIEGTKIFIRNYTGEMYDDYFATSEQVKKLVIHTCRYGQIINDPRGRLYVKDIFVQTLKTARYSYNLASIRLEESRKLASEEDVHSGIGSVWGTVTSATLMKSFLKAVENGKYESLAYGRYPDNSGIIKSAFRCLYGVKAVIGTDADASREAQWRGAVIVPIPFGLRDFIRAAGILTDAMFVKKDDKKKVKKISKTSLAQTEKLTLRSMNVLVRLIDAQYDNRYPKLKVVPYAFSSDESCLGQWIESKVQIRINKNLLSHPTKALSTVLHELTHTYHGSSDMTSHMIHALGAMGANGILLATCSDSKWARAFRYFFRKAVLAALTTPKVEE